MASNSNTRRTVRQKQTISTTNGAWSTPVLLGKLTGSGLLARSVIRCPAGTSVTSIDIVVWMGSADDTGITVANLPDEDVVFRRSSIPVTGSATAADDDYDLLANHLGASYDVRGDDEALWVSIKPTGADEDVVVSLEAVDVK